MITLGEHQKEAVNFCLNDDREQLAWSGSVRSGKSFGSVLALVLHSCTKSDKDYIIVGKSMSAVRRNLVPHFKEVCKLLGLDYHDKHTVLEVDDCRFNLFGGHYSGAEEVIQGMTGQGALLDDLGVLYQEMYQMVVSRLSLPDVKMLMTLNKGSPFHWTKTELIDNAEQIGMVHLDSDISDNPGITEKTINFFESALTGHWKKRLLYNEWAAAAGLVYPSVRIEEFPIGDFKKREAGADFGISTSTAVIFAGLREGTWYIYDEYYWDSEREHYQKSTGEHAEDIRDKDGTVTTYVCDPSAAGLKTSLRRRGCHTINGKNDILQGIQCVEEAAQHGRFVVHPRCKNLVRQLSQLVWSDKAQQRGEDKPEKNDDHATDALRYWCAHRFPIRGSIKITKKPRGL